MLSSTPSWATSSHPNDDQKNDTGLERTVPISIDRGTKWNFPPSMQAELQLIVAWDNSWYAIPNALASNMQKAGLTVLRAPLGAASSVYVPIQHNGTKQQPTTKKEQLLALIEQYGSKVSAYASVEATRLAIDGANLGPQPGEFRMRDNARELRALIQDAIEALPIK